MKHIRSLLLVLIAAAGLVGQAANVSTTVTNNPPPEEKLSGFTHFEMAKIIMVAPYAGQPANEKALLKIQENVSLKADPLLKTWNETGAAVTPVRTLVITPVITEIKFIGGKARVWGGAFAGNSGVIIAVRFTEKETGKEIANPLFFARASAMGGAYTFGSTDNLMLTRVAGRLTDYLAANYTDAVGGPTGADPAKK